MLDLAVSEKRAIVLNDTYAVRPEPFFHSPLQPEALPTAVWITEAQEDAGTTQ